MKNLVIVSIFITILFTSCNSMKATMPAELLTGTSWQLSELNGKGVDASAYSRNLPYITFTTDNKVTGNSGCNSFGGSYNLNDAGGMNISQVMATKMFCEDVNESDFFNTLDKVSMSKAKKDKLILMNGVEEIMVFVPKK